MEVGDSAKRVEDWTGSRVKSSPFLFVVLLLFTGTLPLSSWNKKPSPFLVHGKGGFIHFCSNQKTLAGRMALSTFNIPLLN
jgi:hypothetical protein